MTITLEQLRLEARQQAEELYQACLDRHKGHSLFRVGKMNGGFWRDKWIDASGKNPKDDVATLFSAFLPIHFLDCEGDISPWPWEVRNKIDKKRTTKLWLNALLSLDDQATIYVDLIPKLGDWIGDVFNYIPRDVWSLAAKLISRFYRSSKQLFLSMKTEGTNKDLASDGFFFHKVDLSLKELFDFAKKPKKGKSIKEIFLQLETDVAVKKYGDHSHVHRHCLYLLLQVALLDEEWRDVVFLFSKNSFQPHFKKIKDKSCSSVLNTALLEIAYFDGHSSALDWSLIEKLELEKCNGIVALPNSVETVCNPDFRAAAEQSVRKSVLKIRAIKSNPQLVSRLHYVNQHNLHAKDNPTTTELFESVRQWYGVDEADGEWHEYTYDFLIMWHDRLKNSDGTSLLYSRIDSLNKMSATEQRARLIECFQIFVGREVYRLLTRDERKCAFFDLWYLVDLKDCFEGGFSTATLTTDHWLIFDIITDLNEGILTYLDRTFPKADIGGADYTKKVVLLAILVHAQELRCHQTELDQVLRGHMLSDLLVLAQPSTAQIEQVFGQENTTYPCASPISVWLITNPVFAGTTTPLVYQIFQRFLTLCDSENQKFNLFWRLSLYEPDANIYNSFKKNLSFPFHILKSSMVQYTNVDWSGMCSALSKHEEHRRRPFPAQKGLQKDQNVSDFHNMEEVVADFSSIWSVFLKENDDVFKMSKTPSWNVECWQELTKFWLQWTNDDNKIESYLELKEHTELGSGKLVQFFQNVQKFLTTIPHDVPVDGTGEVARPVSEFTTQFDLLMKKLEGGLENEFEETLGGLLALSPSALKRQVPFELNLMYSDVVTKLQTLLRKIVPREKKFLEWDKEIQSEHISLEVMKSKFTGDAGYWKHTKKAFEKNRVEQFVAQAWIDNFAEGSQLTPSSFEGALKQYDELFETYPESKLHRYQILSLKLAEQPGKLRRAYHPMLTFIDEKMQTLANDSSQEEQDGTWTVTTSSGGSKDATLANLDKALRKQGLHELANNYSRGETLSTGGNLLRFAMNHGFTPFIAAVLSLTQLLDFGGSLLQIYKDFPLSANVISAVASLAFAFGYPFLARHREMGLRFMQSFGNIWPSFVMSFVMSVVLAGIWAEADGEADFGLATILLMLFFTTIVKAGIDGAFDTDKD